MKKNNESGQVLLLTIFALVTVLFTVLFIIGGSQLYFQNSDYSAKSEKATLLAESGIDKAIVALNIPGNTYNGEEETAFGDGTYSVAVTAIDNSSKLITATGYLPNKQNAKIKRTVRIQASNGTGIAFSYGMQVGTGGLVLLNGGTVNGSIYSNGNVVFGNNATVTGDVYVAEGTQPTADQESSCFGLNCVDYIFGKSVSGNNRMYVAQSFVPGGSQSSRINKVDIMLKKQGSPPNLTVRIMEDNNGKPDKNNILATGILPASNVPSGADYSFYNVSLSSSPNLSPNTPYWLMLDPGSSDANNYWYWQNDSSGAYVSGVAKWSSNWNTGNPTWNSISGDFLFKTYMGGIATSVSASGIVTVSGNVHANTITGLTIQKDAYYQSISDSTVSGQSYPNSDDPSPVSFPISDANITSWKNQATSVGVSVGDKTVSNCNTPLGPGKIEGNLTFDNFECTLIIKSPLWVTGNVMSTSDIKLKLDPAFGANPGYMIVDGTVAFNNKSTISGTGTTGGYFMLLSTYDSTINGVDALSAKNTFTADIVYAPYGYLDFQNNTSVVELNGYKVTFHTGAILNYQIGLSKVVFSSGPTGSLTLIKGTYQIY